MSKRISRRVNKMGRPIKYPPVEEAETPMHPYPELPIPPEVRESITNFLNSSTEPEIRRAIAVLVMEAAEHRQAGREERAVMMEACIPPMRQFLEKIMPQRIAERRGATYTIQ